MSTSRFPSFCNSQDIDLAHLSKLCSQDVKRSDYPLSVSVENKVVIYDGGELRNTLNSEESRLLAKEELHKCLKHGPGVLVIKNFYPAHDVVHKNTTVFLQIIKEEKRQGTAAGDHFAKAGENDRIWNSFQKAGEKDPGVFIEYYKNPLYALISESWLGPGYQITAQVNIVKPGGRSQSAHRDYHLGFQSNQTAALYPMSLQVASQYLTLQGAIAHSDMSVESGPTLLLPFSQHYELGYLAWRDETFKGYFNENAVQLPLNTGDALFFSPALFHGAGANETNSDRIVNLIQVSSAFSKPMETIDRCKLMRITYAPLIKEVERQNVSTDELQSILAAVADGYAFPTNLDKVQPIGGTAPESSFALMKKAINEKWNTTQFDAAVRNHFVERMA